MVMVLARNLLLPVTCSIFLGQVLFCWAAAALETSFASFDPRLILRLGELKDVLHILGAEALVLEDLEAVETLERRGQSPLFCVKFIVELVCSLNISKEGWSAEDDARQDSNCLGLEHSGGCHFVENFGSDSMYSQAEPLAYPKPVVGAEAFCRVKSWVSVIL